MAYKGLERRTCIRFVISGATISYRQEKRLFKTKNYEEFCPLLDISRGGLRFLSQKLLKVKNKISLTISIPDEKAPLSVKGHVRWTRLNPGQSYKYQIGIQFNPYGDKKKHNPPGALVKIISLEEKFAKDNQPDSI